MRDACESLKCYQDYLFRFEKYKGFLNKKVANLVSKIELATILLAMFVSNPSYQQFISKLIPQ